MVQFAFNGLTVVPIGQRQRQRHGDALMMHVHTNRLTYYRAFGFTVRLSSQDNQVSLVCSGLFLFLSRTSDATIIHWLFLTVV